MKVRNIAQLIWNTNPVLEYQSQTFDNDYVILKLDGALEFNDDIRPACFPSSTDYLVMNSTEDECFTSGWGTLQVGKNFNLYTQFFIEHLTQNVILHVKTHVTRHVF